MGSEEKVEHDCIICASVLGTNGGTLTLLCGHPFCAECICRWRQRSWRCPVCRVMDGRELTVPPAAAGGGPPGQPRRSGGVGHLGQRLRPMAEQMLAESGDNVLDVLLQLLEGIQDGTLPADLDGVAPDQAAASGRAPPGAASLDRLVLNQLVTVLQATSALIAGRGGGGRPHTAAATAPQNELQQQQQQARPHSGQRRRRSPASAASVLAHRHSRRSRLQGASSRQAADEGPSAEAQPATREMSTQTSDLSDDGVPGSRPSRRERPASAKRLNGATSISPRHTSPDARQAPRNSDPVPVARTPRPGDRKEAASNRETAAVGAAAGSSERPPGLGGLDGPLVKAAVAQNAEPSTALREGSSRVILPDLGSEGTASAPESRDFKSPDRAGASRSSAEAIPGQGRDGSRPREELMTEGKLKSSSEGPQQPSIQGDSAPPTRTGSGGVRALAAMFEHRCSLNAPSPAPHRPWAQNKAPSGSALGSSSTAQPLLQPGSASQEQPAAAGDADAASVQQPTAELQLTGTLKATSPAAAATAAASAPAAAEASVRTETRAAAVPDSVFQASSDSPAEQPSAVRDPFADLLAGFGIISERQPDLFAPDTGPTGACQEHADPIAILKDSGDPASDAHTEDAAVSPPERALAASAAPGSGQPSVRAQGIQTDDSEAAAGETRSSGAATSALPGPSSLGSPAGSAETDSPDIAEAQDTFLVDSGLLAPSLDGYGDASAASSCLTSPALSPRQRASAARAGLRMPGRRHTSSLTEEAHLPPAAPASRAATPRIVAPPNTATHSLANSEANSPRIMAEPPPGLRLPLPLLALSPGTAQAEGGAGAGAATSGVAEEQQEGEAGEPSSDASASTQKQPPLQEPAAAAMRSPRHNGGWSRPDTHSGDRERLLLRAVDEVEALVDALLGRWNSMPASQQPDHLAERMEELFLEASMLEAVRNNQVPKPRAMVEDILTRVALLDDELSRYTGQPSQSVCLASPRTSGGPAARPQLESPRPGAGRAQPSRIAQALATRSSSSSREGGRVAARSAAAGPQPPAERRHRRPTVAVAAQPAGPDGEATAQAAEADGALERFTEFLARHEGELQPRTRQIAELALALARLSLANNPSSSDARIPVEAIS